MKKVFIVLLGLAILFQPASSFAVTRAKESCFSKGTKKIVKGFSNIHKGIKEMVNCFTNMSECTEEEIIDTTKNLTREKKEL